MMGSVYLKEVKWFFLYYIVNSDNILLIYSNVIVECGIVVNVVHTKPCMIYISIPVMIER